MTMKPYGIDTARLAGLREREERTFAARTAHSAVLLERATRSMPSGVPMQWMAGLYRHPPLFVAQGRGAYFTDVDGNRYLDMNLVDYAGSLGFDPDPVMEAIRHCTREGLSFLLPHEDGILAAELMAARTGLPMWQFSGSASGANTEAIRIARLATGREKILMFEGRYHGHVAETLLDSDTGAETARAMGMRPASGSMSRVVPFNDLAALEEALADRGTACVIAEPMLTNCNIVLPEPGFWQAARAIIARAGSLLVIDEAHTFVFAHGGLAAGWSLQPDMMVAGKGIGTGLPFALLGLSGTLGRFVSDHLDVDVAAPEGLALGGTTYGNRLVMTAARAALEACLTPQAHARNEALGARLSVGLAALFEARGLDWRSPHVGGRGAWILAPDLPRNASEAARSLDPDFVDTRRVFMANRGIWEAIASAGPSVSFAQTEADVDFYLEVARAFLDEVAPGRSDR